MRECWCRSKGQEGAPLDVNDDINLNAEMLGFVSFECHEFPFPTWIIKNPNFICNFGSVAPVKADVYPNIELKLMEGNFVK